MYWLANTAIVDGIRVRYEALERVCINGLKLRPNSVRFIVTKVLSDTFVFGPVHLLAFFTYMGLASGRPWEIVKQDVQRDFIPTFMTEGTGWMCVQVRKYSLPHFPKVFCVMVVRILVIVQELNKLDIDLSLIKCDY